MPIKVRRSTLWLLGALAVLGGTIAVTPRGADANPVPGQHSSPSPCDPALLEPRSGRAAPPPPPATLVSPAAQAAPPGAAADGNAPAAVGAAAPMATAIVREQNPQAVVSPSGDLVPPAPCYATVPPEPPTLNARKTRSNIQNN